MLIFSARETLFVFGGQIGSEYLDSVEAISLSSSNVECQDVSALPYGIALITAATVGGSPVSCGGVGG